MNYTSQASQILDELSRQAVLSPEERSNEEYNEFMKPYLIERNVEYPEPDYLIEIGGVPTMPKGNLVAVSAKWKSGKTFFCDILTAIFLGSDRFINCRSLKPDGKALFFDTEQSESDSQRIQMVIDAMSPEYCHDNCRVACLQTAPIDGSGYEVSRYGVISRAVSHERPDLVVIDGIADLIYNFNDVNESKEIVNDLSMMANKYNCCIVVVMHQNKSSIDKNMKGHLGTMLYQKCSDVFSLEKHGDVFLVSHSVSRHRTSGGICFKLDACAVPVDAAADRKLQLEQKRQEDKAELHSKMTKCMEGFYQPLKCSDVINLIQTKLGVGKTRAYQLFNSAKVQGVLSANENKLYSLQTL